MTVFDLDQHQPIAYLPMADGADVIKFDAGLKRIYVACYSGAISVFHEDDPEHFRKLGDVPVQPKVHSIAVDEQTHRVYAPEQEENGRPVSRMIIYEAIPIFCCDKINLMTPFQSYRTRNSSQRAQKRESKDLVLFFSKQPAPRSAFVAYY